MAYIFLNGKYLNHKISPREMDTRIGIFTLSSGGHGDMMGENQMVFAHDTIPLCMVISAFI